MSNVINFDFEQKKVGVVEINGDAWFVAKDLAIALGYSATSAMNKHIEEEDRQITMFQNGTTDLKQSLINESGVYSAIFGSKKPEAKRFKKWVTNEVLPRIRKTGGYIQGEENFQSEDELIFHAMQVMQRKINDMKPKAEWFDEYVGIDGTMNTTDVAKQLGISAQKLNKWMREQGIKFKNKDLPRDGFNDWFKVVSFNNNSKVGQQCRITPKGVVEITQMYQAS